VIIFGPLNIHFQVLWSITKNKEANRNFSLPQAVSIVPIVVESEFKTSFVYKAENFAVPLFSPSSQFPGEQ